MNIVRQKNPIKLVCLSMSLLTAQGYAKANTFIEPPMVAIPAGTFHMGSERGEPDELPVREVSVAAFQMGKYEVTNAEFSLFIKDTGYEMPDNCYQYVLGGPHMEKLASWNDHIYKFSDYHPVACLPQKAATEYAKWLSEKTGKSYRLPTEAEWEYTVRAGTTTKFHFGNENQPYKSCRFANISDWYANDKSAEIFEGAHVRDVEQCSDNEATLSMVGVYEPNQFGVHDLTGNLMEYLADCYVDSYASAPTDGSAVTIQGCDKFVVRGGSWHWYPWYSAERGYITNDFLGALEGFRLVLDTQGKALPSQKGTDAFVKKLTVAQAKVKNQHENIASYPSAPKGLRVVSADTSSVALNWQANPESFVSGYVVYRQDPLTNENKAISGRLESPAFVDKSPLSHNAVYTVVAFNGSTESQASQPVDTEVPITHLLPMRIEGEAYSYADKAEVRFSVVEPDHDKVINSLDDRAATYRVKVDKQSKFKLDARVYHAGEHQLFELWLGDRKLATQPLSGDRGWKTLKDIPFELTKGTHLITIKAANNQFAVNWLDVKAG